MKFVSLVLKQKRVLDIFDQKINNTRQFSPKVIKKQFFLCSPRSDYGFAISNISRFGILIVEMFRKALFLASTFCKFLFFKCHKDYFSILITYGYFIMFLDNHNF